MFGANKLMRGPVLSFMFLDHETLDAFEALDWFSNEESKPIMAAYIWQLCRWNFTTQMFESGQVTKDKYLEHVAAIIARDDRIGRLVRANTENNTLQVVLINLLQGAKKKSLTNDNVKGFFAGIGVDNVSVSTICKLVNNSRNFIPNMAGSEDYRAVMSDSTWQTYRMTTAAWQGLLRKISADLITWRIIDVDRIETLLEIDSSDAEAMKAVRPDELVIISAYYDAAGTLPKDWHQGKNAVGAYNPRRYTSMVRCFKKIFELTSETGNLDSVTDIGTVVGLFAKIMGGAQ